jgi:hypothetical protein
MRVRPALLLAAAFALSAADASAAQPVPGKPAAPAGRTARPTPPLTSAEVHVTAKEAYLYGYPLVANARVLHAQALERGGAQLLAPLNQLAHAARSTFSPMAYLDLAHCFAWLDLRAEPMLLTLPAVEDGRYFSVQLVDLYTHNLEYLGARTTGRAGGVFLIAGPGWKGSPPPGVVKVVRAETQVVLALIRIQLRDDAADLARVQSLRCGLRLQPLSAFLRKPPPRLAPPLKLPRPPADVLTTPAFFEYLATVLELCPAHPADQAARTRFARVGIDPVRPLRIASLPPEMREAFAGGLADARMQIEARRVRGVDPSQLFGPRERVGSDTTLRALGAMAGLYGDSREEALYPLYLEDVRGEALDGSRQGYRLRFAPDGAPPVDGFWSLTLYALPDQMPFANPLRRHVLGSAALPGLVRDADGGITIDIQAQAPEPARQANWLPAPEGPFMLALRLYWPKEAALTGEWKPPQIERR